jgi:hypothetical protein
MVARSSNLYFPIGDVELHLAWFRKEGIYPTYHCLAIRNSVAEGYSMLAAGLVEAFDRAAHVAPRYMGPDERKLYDREIALLGVDPNQSGLNAIHRKTVEKCVNYLEQDGLLARWTTMREIFPLSGA